MGVRELWTSDLARYHPLSGNQVLNGVLRAIISPGFLACVVIRVQQAAHRRSPMLGALLRSANYHLTGVESHVTIPIGPGLYLPHPSGICLGTDVTIGRGVTILHNTSVGTKGLFDPELQRWPTLKDGCVIGTGACVLGDVTIGENAVVGANAVAMHDVPAGGTYFGFPTRG